MTLKDKEVLYRVVYRVSASDKVPMIVYTPSKTQVDNLKVMYRVESVAIAVAVWAPEN